MHRGRLVAQQGDGHLVLPGGGVDAGESLARGARRETLEEVGALIQDLTPFRTVRVPWTSAWANTPKRRERFKVFRGEEEHIFIGTVRRFQKPTSTEGDAWTGPKTMSVNKALQFSEDTLDSQTHEFQLLQVSKMCAIRAAQLVYAPGRAGGARRTPDRK